MNEFLQQIDEAASQPHEPLLEGKYLQMIGVEKYDFSTDFRKMMSSALGVNMDVDLTTQRLFNPSETKIARTIINDIREENQFIYLIRSRGDAPVEPTATDIAKEDVADTIASKFTRLLSVVEAENKPKSEDYGIEYDGRSASGEISDEDAETIEASTELHNFYMLTNIHRIAKRVQPDLPTGGSNRMYLVTNIDGMKPLQVEIISATLSNLVSFLRENTSTINFVYKILAKQEHSQFMHVPLQVLSDDGEILTPVGTTPIEDDVAKDEEVEETPAEEPTKDAPVEEPEDGEEDAKTGTTGTTGTIKPGEKVTTKTAIGSMKEGKFVPHFAAGTKGTVVESVGDYVVIKTRFGEEFATLARNVQ